MQCVSCICGEPGKSGSVYFPERNGWNGTTGTRWSTVDLETTFIVFIMRMLR